MELTKKNNKLDKLWYSVLFIITLLKFTLKIKVIEFVFWIFLVVFVIRMVVIFRKRRIWKVSNKLFFSSIFFIITPAVLLALFFMTAINVLIGQYGTRLFENLMDNQLTKVEQLSAYYLNNLRNGNWGIENFKSRMSKFDLDFIDFKILILKKVEGQNMIFFCYPNELITANLSTYQFSGYCRINGRIHHGALTSDGNYSVMILFPLSKKYLQQISRINDFRIEFGEDRGDPFGEDQKKDIEGIPWESAYSFLDFDELFNGAPKKKSKKFYLYVNLQEIFKKLLFMGSSLSNSSVLKFFYFILVIFSIFLLLSFLIGFKIIRKLTSSIDDLTEGMKKACEEKYPDTVPKKSTDQIEYLHDSLNDLRSGLFDPNEINQVDREEMLKLSRNTQLKLIPDDYFINKLLELSASNIPKGVISNTYYDYTFLPDGAVFVDLVDLISRDISVILPMTFLKGSLCAIRHTNDDVRKWLFSCKNQLTKFFDQSILKMACIKFDEKSKTAEMVKTDNINILHFRSENGEIENLLDGGRGNLEKTSPKLVIKLTAGDIFFLFTSSLLKIENENGSILKREDLYKIITDNKLQSAPQLKEKILDFIIKFSDNISNWNDLSFIVIKVN